MALNADTALELAKKLKAMSEPEAAILLINFEYDAWKEGREELKAIYRTYTKPVAAV